MFPTLSLFNERFAALDYLFRKKQGNPISPRYGTAHSASRHDLFFESLFGKASTHPAP
jgi:hypothetical protein